MNKENAYFCLVTWDNGTEGLLFPRPGNVPIAKTLEEGQKDFGKVKEHLRDYLGDSPGPLVKQVRLIRYEQQEVVEQWPKKGQP